MHEAPGTPELILTFLKSESHEFGSSIRCLPTGIVNQKRGSKAVVQFIVSHENDHYAHLDSHYTHQNEVSEHGTPLPQIRYEGSEFAYYITD
jgi:hypothetical protein